MISIGRLSLAAWVALVSQACFHHTTVKAITVDEPGVHVVSSVNGTSVVWYDGKQHRACTLPGSGRAGAVGPGKWATPHGLSERAPQSNMLDSALFRLCEARGNGDISAGQYSAAIDALTSAVERGHGGAQRWERKTRLLRGDDGEGCPYGECPYEGAGPGGGCPHCSGSHGAAAPHKKRPQPGAGAGPKAGPMAPAQKPAAPPKPPGAAKPPVGPPTAPQ